MDVLDFVVFTAVAVAGFMVTFGAWALGLAQMIEWVLA